jgi:hypothetical protein
MPTGSTPATRTMPLGVETGELGVFPDRFPLEHAWSLLIG